jgi:two-component system sensor histidine kinase BaeS
VPSERIDRQEHRKRGWSLSARLIGLLIGVAALVAIIGGILSLQFLRTTVEDESRTQLSRVVDLLSANYDSAAAQKAGDAWMQTSGDLLAIVSPEGDVSGTASQYVTPEITKALLAGQSVSDTKLQFRAPVILEGRPVAGGGGIVLVETDTTISAVSRDLVLRILPALAIGVAVAALAGIWLTRRIARPLVQTSRAAARLAAGERGVPAIRSEIPEVRAVADALATLDSALATSEGRQREFLLSISHEIRTPLTAMRGYAEALSDGLVASEDLPEVGETLRQETDRLNRFVTDLLELARLEADDFAISPSPVDLDEVVAASQLAWRATAQTLGVEISVQTPDAPIAATTDARRIRQIVDGLVENALRVTPSGGRLTIALWAPDAHHAAITVRDTGPGLSDDDLAHAFERGVLRDRYGADRPVGSGLGLSIAARLTGRLGGTIAAARAPDGGTEFTVRLPLAPPPGPG